MIDEPSGFRSNTGKKINLKEMEEVMLNSVKLNKIIFLNFKNQIAFQDLRIIL